VVPDIRQIRSTVVVAGTALGGESKARELDLPQKPLRKSAIRGSINSAPIPRTGVLGGLGLDQCRPIALWLPTYRMARGPHHRTWCDAADLSSSAAGGQFIEAISAAAEDLRLPVIVKPHPDADPCQ
jgi:hypothetical protein